MLTPEKVTFMIDNLWFLLRFLDVLLSSYVFPKLSQTFVSE